MSDFSSPDGCVVLLHGLERGDNGKMDRSVVWTVRWWSTLTVNERVNVFNERMNDMVVTNMPYVYLL